MLPITQPPAPGQEKNRAPKSPPPNLWQELEPYQQKLLAQQWAHLLRRMQLAGNPNKEAPNVDG